MTNTNLLQAMGHIDPELIVDAAPDVPQKKCANKVWIKWCALAACVCLVVRLGTLMLPRNPHGSGIENEDNWWGSSDSEIGAIRREVFSPKFPSEAEAAFADVPGVLKTYRTLSNSWFLSEKLTDFSQILMDEAFYVVPGSSEGIGGKKENGAYSFYILDENGEPLWGSGVGGGSATIPYQFSGLTEEIIQEDLAGVDYEDYIIAQSNQLYTVFIWARCADGEDMFVTYPARPDFVGLENRGRYTLSEIQHILTECYEECLP